MRLRRTAITCAISAAAFVIVASTTTVGATAATKSTKVPAAAVSGRPLTGHHVRPVTGGHLNSTSTNWSGYAATGTFTSVSAHWVQPAGSCTSRTTYSSFWVGLDGYNSNSVEQTGSEVDCSRGTPRYYSWYEMYPAYPVNYSDTVQAGDSFSATVSYLGSNQYQLVLSDTTRGWSHSVTQSLSGAPRSSAEVIAEAPSSSSGVLPLTNFGTANFTASTANGSPIGNFSPDKIDMVSGSTTKATTSALSGGTAFSVTWHHV
jgi:hypothetical protein